ncbi:MAG: hypothetical protein PHG00_14770 [Methylococcales bacterium]|nr:hypothetical protein [Methylococcales bacterium]
MHNHTFHPDHFFYFLESQVNKLVPERLELLPGLRIRFSNLLRDEIVSVVLEFDGSHYVIAVAAVGEPLFYKPIDHYIPRHLLDRSDPFEWQSLLSVAEKWVTALDGVDAAREFGLFTQHSLALIERISCNSAYVPEQEADLENAENARAFYLALTLDMTKEYAPAIEQKVQAAVRKIYKSRPANGMVGDECQTEWQELGAMVLDGTHLLLDMGIHQLQLTVACEIEALSRSDKLALWFSNCGYIEDYVSDNKPDDSFELSEDSYTFEEIVESIARNLQNDMVWDWEKRLSEIENALDSEEPDSDQSEPVLEETIDQSEHNTEESVTAHVAILQNIIDGRNDNDELMGLMDKIEAAAQALVNASLVEDFNRYDKLIGDAATKWAELDVKFNG